MSDNQCGDCRHWQFRSGGGGIETWGECLLPAVSSSPVHLYGTNGQRDTFMQTLATHCCSAWLEPLQPLESAEDQIDRLTKFVRDQVAGEPSASEGVVETVIRLLGVPAVNQGDSSGDAEL